MKNLYKILILIAVAVIAFVSFYGIRQWRLAQQEKSFNQMQLIDGLLQESISFENTDYLIPPNQIYNLGLNETETPAITNPKFVSVDEADQLLADSVEGVAVEANGKYRYYSYQILNWHAVVNDNFEGKKFAVTYCDLCKSAAVYEVDDTFSSANKVYNNDLLLKDSRTDSLWLQIRGIAISGEKIGQKLNSYPFEVMDWVTFKELHPTGDVLSTDTGYSFDYTRHPLGQYDISKLIYFPLNNTDDRISLKWMVSGLNLNGEQMAFADQIMAGFGVVNVTVGEKPVVGIYDFDHGFTRVFSSEVDGQTLTFNYDFDKQHITDEQTGSTWNVLGEAIQGKLRGKQLSEYQAPEMFWMCWSSNFPKTKIAKMESDTE